MLLAKLWDKVQSGMRKSIPVNTPFLTPRELEMARYLFGQPEGLTAFGGCGEAEHRLTTQEQPSGILGVNSINGNFILKCI